MSKRRQIGLLHKGGWQLSTSIVGSNAVVYSKTSVASCVMVCATSLWNSPVPYITFAFTFALGSLPLNRDKFYYHTISPNRLLVPLIPIFRTKTILQRT